MKISVIHNMLHFQTRGMGWSFASAGTLISAYLLPNGIISHEQFSACDKLSLWDLQGKKIGEISSITRPSEQFSSFVAVKPLLPLSDYLARVTDFSGGIYIADFKNFTLRPEGLFKINTCDADFH